MDELSQVRGHLTRCLDDLIRYRMPFGRYGPSGYPPFGKPIHELPLEYLAWFQRRGFPDGRLGELMQFVYEVKANGAEEVLEPLRKSP